MHQYSPLWRKHRWLAVNRSRWSFGDCSGRDSRTSCNTICTCAHGGYRQSRNCLPTSRIWQWVLYNYCHAGQETLYGSKILCRRGCSRSERKSPLYGQCFVHCAQEHPASTFGGTLLKRVPEIPYTRIYFFEDHFHFITMGWADLDRWLVVQGLKVDRPVVSRTKSQGLAEMYIPCSIGSCGRYFD